MSDDSGGFDGRLSKVRAVGTAARGGSKELPGAAERAWNASDGSLSGGRTVAGQPDTPGAAALAAAKFAGADGRSRQRQSGDPVPGDGRAAFPTPGGVAGESGTGRRDGGAEAEPSRRMEGPGGGRAAATTTTRATGRALTAACARTCRATRWICRHVPRAAAYANRADNGGARRAPAARSGGGELRAGRVHANVPDSGFSRGRGGVASPFGDRRRPSTGFRYSEAGAAAASSGTCCAPSPSAACRGAFGSAAPARSGGGEFRTGRVHATVSGGARAGVAGTASSSSSGWGHASCRCSRAGADAS